MKYVLPIVIFIIWIGELGEIINRGSFDQLIITVILSAILLISCFVFTRLPAKDSEWYDVDERV